VKCIRSKVVAVAAVLSGCGQPPGQYAMGVHEVYERLLNSDFTEFRYDRQCGILIHIKADGHPDRSITWEVSSIGRRMLTFTARLTPVDATHTKIDIDVSKEANGREAYDGNQKYWRPAVRQPIRPAVEEQIASTLAGRPYSDKHLPHKIIPANDACDIQQAGLITGLYCVRADDPPTIEAADAKCPR
jgi:hypothetical protein